MPKDQSATAIRSRPHVDVLALALIGLHPLLDGPITTLAAPAVRGPMVPPLERAPVLREPADGAPLLRLGRDISAGVPAVLDGPGLDGGDGAEHVPGVGRGAPEVVEVGLDEDAVGGAGGDERGVRGRASVDGRGEGEEDVWVAFLGARARRDRGRFGFG